MRIAVMRIILAIVIGLVVGASSSLVILGLKGPVFEWEMAGMVMTIICAVFGGVCGGVTSAFSLLAPLQTLPRAIAGLCVGAALGLAVGLVVLFSSSANHPDAPEGLAFWTVAMVVIAGALAGLIGGLLGTTNDATN